MLPAAPSPYFANAAGSLSLDPAGFLRAHWSRGPRRLADTQALFEHMAQALREHGWGRILINQVEMPPFTTQEQEWVARHWLPRAVQQAGYRFGAVVVSPQVLTRLATAYITTSVQGLPLTYRSFDRDADAAAWLLEQPL
ncbi:hypothetical protein [Hymenobacter jeollabukensis]|uniref:STAS/SEC14 domain-containing protein n=1 Tax=Hymenobacter jeollabukensis TaxID=2025313 RepID=A0A5R8WI59_9BACT|nr:hypothetical protein [Hymenobacter jeollabukensis]TLM87893.1 hypothetical protein FDY95_24945 [Hymenobacter jeollabukensis]